MKKSPFAALLLAVSSSAFAGVTVSNCQIREPAPNVNRTALFLTADFQVTDEVKAMRIPGDEAILSAEIPALTDKTEIHQSKITDGVMSMHAVPRVVLNKNSQVEFKPGGLHIMLMDLKKRPVAGETYPVKFWLTYLDDVECNATVVKVGA